MIEVREPVQPAIRLHELRASAVELGGRVAAGTLTLDLAATALVDVGIELGLPEEAVRIAVSEGLRQGMGSGRPDPEPEPPPRRQSAARLRLLAHHARPQRLRLALILVLTVAASLLAVLAPLPLKILADYGFGDVPPPALLTQMVGGGDPSAETWIVVAAAAAFLLALTAAAVEAGLGWFWEAAGQRMVFDLANRVYRHLQRLSLAFHLTRPLGDSLSRVTEDTWSVYSAADALFVSPLARISVIVAVATSAWILDPSLAVVSLVVAPVLGASAFWFGRQIKVRSRRVHDIQGSMVGFTQQTLSIIPLVQAFTAQRRNRRRFDALADEAVEASQRQVLADRSFALVNGLTTATGAAVVIFAGSRRVLDDRMSIGTLLVFVAYLATLQIEVRELLSLFGKFRAAEAGLDRVLEVLQAEVEVKDPPHPHRIGPDGLRGDVALQRVTVGYQPGRPVLTDITLRASPGQTVALVGRTGAGKSTLVSLIPRFFDPWAGQVTIDGIDLRDLRLTDLRRHVALVTQEPALLPLSIADNIAYGRPDADRAAIIDAAITANAAEFIDQLPDGYDTILGERGATLSGGQRQRLAIARALLKDAPVLILDEPTSALDAETEHLLLDALDRLIANRTTLVIAHRLSTIRNADLIAVLDHGHLTQTGTHHELLATNPLYQHLHQLQTAVDLAAVLT